MSPDSATLELCAPGSPLEVGLVARLQGALGEGKRVWYLVPDARTRRRRLAALARHLPPKDPAVGTLRDLALHALRTAGEPVVLPPDPKLVEALLEQALSTLAAQLPSGPGLAAAARDALARLLHDGWDVQGMARAIGRLEERDPDSCLPEALRRALRALCPAVDLTEPLRRARRAGILAPVAPEVLLIEGGLLESASEAELLRDLVRCVRESGGEVHACCLDLPGSGPRGRMLSLLREVLSPLPCLRAPPAPI